MINYPIVILAGGKSSRMGRDKALLPFGNYSSLAEYQLNRFKNSFESLYISTKSKKKFDFLKNVNFIEDSNEFNEFSPLVALYSILKNFKKDVCILSVDTPFVTIKTYEKLLESKGRHDVAIAKSSSGSHQLCAIYSPKILPAIQAQLKRNEHRIKETLNKIKCTYVEFEDDREFINLNYFDDYKKALKW